MGGPSAATKKQQQVTLEASQQQVDFDKQLMGLFQKQFASQQDVLDKIKATVEPIMSRAAAGQGFSPEALAAMRTSATEGLTNQFENAKAALNQELKTSGSSDVPSGVTAGLDTALLNQEAQAEAGAQRNITLENEQQAQGNIWNSLNVLNGVSAQENPLGYASSATGGSGAVAGLGESQSALQNAITNASNSSFFGKLESGIATGIGNIPFAIH